MYVLKKKQRLNPLFLQFILWGHHPHEHYNLTSINHTSQEIKWDFKTNLEGKDEHKNSLHHILGSRL